MVGLHGAGMESVMWCLQRSLYGGSAWSWNEERDVVFAAQSLWWVCMELE